MEHVGVRGVQLPVDVEMEAYGGQAAAASNQFSSKSRGGQAGNHVITNITGKVRQVT